MSMVVQHNLTAMFTNRQLKITGGKRSKSAEKLASGYRVNRAADDAAGLSISEKMRKQIRGLTQASENLQDGVSLAQVADGALTEVHDMIHRINELAVKAANGTMSLDDRDCINDEVQALKREMSRVFKTTKFNDLEIFRTVDTIYNPEIEGYPTDMGVFHKGNGGIGGLEFNNVRYSIAELQEAGLLIDDDGIATQDFDVEFKLWDGEKVKLKMDAGQSLDKAVRNYEWEAKEEGIYINGKLSAEWKEMLVDGKDKVITNIDKLPPGEYSFTHHGMKVIFEVDSELDIDNMKERINGTDEIPPATWDVRVGEPKRSQAADITTTSFSIRVTNANKDVISHTYYLAVDENGIAVKDTSAGTQTAYVAWSSFKDSSLTSVKDENGNDISTNGGYPIVDWGTDSGTTGESSVTLDADATYHFKSPNNNVPIEFNFKIADSASLDEVISALNGNTLRGQAVSAPGTLRVTNADTTYGTITLNSNGLSFDTQRYCDRDFNNSVATLSGDLKVKRITIDGEPSAADRVTNEGTYEAGSGHTLSADIGRTHVLSSSTDSLAGVDEYYKETDEYGVDHFYHVWKVAVDEVYDDTWQKKDTWTQNVRYGFSGRFAEREMTSMSIPQTENWERTLSQSQRSHKQYYTNRMEEVFAPEDESIYTDVAVGTALSRINIIDSETTSYDDVQTVTPDNATFVSVGTSEFLNMGVLTNGYIPFSFTYTVTKEQAQALIDNSGVHNLGDTLFQATNYATKTFRPRETTKSISEAQFSDITVNDVQVEIPPRSLRIQSGADSGDKIEMVWKPLNLSQLGMYTTKTLTQEQAERAIDQAVQALQVITETRMLFGAYQNRFEHAIKMTDNTVENTTYAESMIRDTDMAKEMVQYSNVDIIAQAGQAMLAQANQSNQGVLALLS